MSRFLVLLDRWVRLGFKEEDGAAEKNKGVVAAAAPTLKSLMDATVSFLGSLTADGLLNRPPKISNLRLRSSIPVGDARVLSLGSYAFVACADKSMLILYGGKYSGPGSSTRGCYLIYDSAVSGSSALTSTVPPLPLSPYLNSIGEGAVVLRSHPPASWYIIAELATSFERCFPDAELYLWRSDDSATPQCWEKKAVRLPPEVDDAQGKHIFEVDTSFSYGDSSLCWVDLLRGIVIYRLDDSQFRFIPLPDDCPEFGTSQYPYRPRMQEVRAAACVAGAIKLVALEGFLEGWNSQEFRFVTWTLTPDLRQWEKCAVFHVKDIWASDNYLALKIPHQTPICPVLSPTDNCVFVIVNDVEINNIVRGSEVVETKVDIKGQFVLALDIQNNQIISAHGGRPTSRMADLTPNLVAADLGPTCLEGPKEHERDVEATEVESGKRLKLY